MINCRRENDSYWLHLSQDCVHIRGQRQALFPSCTRGLRRVRPMNVDESDAFLGNSISKSEFTLILQAMRQPEYHFNRILKSGTAELASFAIVYCITSA